MEVPEEQSRETAESRYHSERLVQHTHTHTQVTSVIEYSIDSSGD